MLEAGAGEGRTLALTSTLDPSARSGALRSTTMLSGVAATAGLPSDRAERSALWKSTSRRW